MNGALFFPPVLTYLLPVLGLTLASCSTREAGIRHPLPPGVTEIEFSEFFVTPFGPRGLTLTEKLRGLDGRYVRISGHMVRQQERTPGRFLLTSRPVQVHEEHYGLADDLPPATLHVLLPRSDELVPFTSRRLLLTGRLSVGNREEPDGRISVVRLTLDSPLGLDAFVPE